MRLGMMYLKGEDYEDRGFIAPLSFGYLSAYLETHLNFHDTILEVDNRDALLRQSPDIIGLSSFTETFEDVIHHARHFKQLDASVPLIVGGEHISAAPETLPPEVDIGVLGEGEETLFELMQLYQRNEATPENLSKINGLVFWHKGERIITAPRAWIEDMDSIPMPNRELLLKDTQWQQPIFTARGCPYKCTFCASTRFWQRTRYHSVERVIQEIEYIVSHFPDQSIIPINDDLFPLNKKRMRAIVDAIRAKGLHKKVGFSLNARASVFDEEIARMIVQMNGLVVCFGLESASDRILTALKGKTSARDNQRALEICERFNLPVVSNMMIGVPEETEEDMARSYWFIQSNHYRFAQPTIAYATPFPGTELWKQAQDLGALPPNFENWDALNLSFERGRSVYMNQHLRPETFESIYDRFQVFQTTLQAGKQQLHAWLTKRKYFEHLYKTLLEDISIKGPVLEIGFEAFCLADLQPDLKVTKILIASGKAELTPIEAKQQYATILLSHALEKLRDPIALLQSLHAYLKPEGHILCIYYNARHPALMEQLLRGKWEASPFGVNHHHALRFISHQSLQPLLKRSRWHESQSQVLLASPVQMSDKMQQALQLLNAEGQSQQEIPVTCLSVLQSPSTSAGRILRASEKPAPVL
ncbi:MAG: radical SAM protein [Candidatus Sericytochromatia bacterium]|nr:radical SAM protein [Candidatus Sericytochromatia bacterium]